MVSESLSSPTSDSDDTKKSFDFTGEIKRLNESGVSHRRSFIDQLEHAFKTPAKVDLRYGFEVEGEESFYRLVNAEEEVPPVPKLDPKYLSVGSALGAQDHGPVEDEEEEEEETHSNRWSRGDGELNRSFRFGGMSSQQSFVEDASMDMDVASETKPVLTLSDILPPPGHSPASSMSATEEDSMVLRSIYDKAHEMNPIIEPMAPMPRPRVNSDTSVHRMSTRFSRDSFFGPSARSSVASFTGFESFEQVRRGFEFHDYRPNFYPPAHGSTSFNTMASRRVLHSKHESTFSVASISSVGHVLNHGVADPFDYGLPTLAERPSSENLSCLSGSVDDTFSFMHHLPQRQRADSDASTSSFYFRAPPAFANSSAYQEHRRRESAMSVNSIAPPISLYNKSFGGNRSHHARNDSFANKSRHTRNDSFANRSYHARGDSFANRSHHVRDDSTGSFSSLAHSYAVHGANGGRAAWARHRQDASVDSVASDFSAMRLGRPGLGDKMFETAAPGGPLTSIMASPLEDQEDRDYSYSGRYGSSYDSLMDGTQQSSAEPDSLFEQTGYKSELVSDDSVFFDASSRCVVQRQMPRVQGQPHGQLFRPVSVMSFASDHPEEHHDDTMISMLGGGHVRRMSVGSVVNGSPCVNKRKYSHLRSEYANQDVRESPKKARLVEKPSFAPSVASTASFNFGEERMIRVSKGHFHRDSLEENCLTGEGEDYSGTFRFSQVFPKPLPARSRSSTVTTSSSGGDTPPLSSYDSSSQSEAGSVSSIDLAHINSLLANATHPVTVGSRARARARGSGHRRLSQAHMSRSSVYETIEEEQPSSVHNSPAVPAKTSASPAVRQAVYIVDPASPEYNMWDDEQGVEIMRRYYALRDEASDAVAESQKTWHDTPFSLFALQSFAIPQHQTGMEALLEHSIKNYGPLPYRLRQRTQSRTSSRASPYPSPSVRSIKSASLEVHRPSPRVQEVQKNVTLAEAPALPLQSIRQNSNLPQSRAPPLPSHKPWESPEVLKPAASLKENGLPRTRVASGTRRAALGWSKRSNGPKSSTGQKENVGVAQGTVTTPGDSLRINRPRPKGRPTPASARFARV